MKSKAIEIASVHLQCDAPNCDHVETVPEICAALIGKRCPKCGADLLTKEDYEHGKMLEGLTALVNDLVGPIEHDVPKESALRLSINPHAGAVTIKVGSRES